MLHQPSMVLLDAFAAFVSTFQVPPVLHAPMLLRGRASLAGISVLFFFSHSLVYSVLCHARVTDRVWFPIALFVLVLSCSPLYYPFRQDGCELPPQTSEIRFALLVFPSFFLCP